MHIKDTEKVAYRKKGKDSEHWRQTVTHPLSYLIRKRPPSVSYSGGRTQKSRWIPMAELSNL